MDLARHDLWRGKKKNWACTPQNREKLTTMQAQIFFGMSEVMAGKVHKKNWPLTFMGQISQAQNAIIEIAILSAGLFCDICLQ